MKVKKKLGKLEGFILFITCVIGGRIIGGFSGENAAIKHRMKAASDAAIRAGVPNEFFGVKWLASIEDVKRAHPDAMQTGGKNNGYKFDLKSAFYERPATISFEFDNRALVEIQIEFTDASSPDSFLITKSRAERDFGPFPIPAKKDIFIFYAELQKEEFLIVHSLGGYGQPVEKLNIKLSRWPGLQN